MTNEVRNPNDETAELGRARKASFVLRHSFVLRASSWILYAAVLLAFLLAPPPAGADEESPRLRSYRGVVDLAVDRGLTFLVRDQAGNPAANGSFTDQYGATNGVVGLAGMAFLARGYRPDVPPYGAVINRSIDYILNTETKNGYLGVRGGKMYEHGIATLFLSEVSGMVDPARQQRIELMLPRAVKIILDAQNVPKQSKDGLVDQGGWRYEPDSKDSDLSVTGWCLMALRSARLNGAPVPNSSIDQAVVFIDRCRNRNSGGYGYLPGHRHHSNRRWLEPDANFRLTGVALLCRELSGQHNDETSRKAGDFILGSLAGSGGFLPEGHEEYGTYYCAQAMFQLGGDYWETFAARMYQHLPAIQDNDGAWRTLQGAAYPTAMYVLALSVSYRQLPIYQR